MPLRERMMIVQALAVNLTIKSIDEDQTVCYSKFVNEMYRNKFDKIIFCNGDRVEGGILQNMTAMNRNRAVYDLEKSASSSWLTKGANQKR